MWLFSLVVVIGANLIGGSADPLTLAATVVGVTSLIFAAKGNVWAQILMIAFSILYGIVSWRFRYWGEMITYLGMTMPMAVWSLITWIRHPSEEDKSEIRIQKLGAGQWIGCCVCAAVATVAFAFVLRALDTPNLVFSTISVTTSFFAAALTMLRSSYYAVGYAANDVVLVVLWMLASLENPAYIPVVVNFAIFFLNDLYGFISWKRRERKQSR